MLHSPWWVGPRSQYVPFRVVFTAPHQWLLSDVLLARFADQTTQGLWSKCASHFGTGGIAQSGVAYRPTLELVELVGLAIVDSGVDSHLFSCFAPIKTRRSRTEGS